jgi:hypothetical protein
MGVILTLEGVGGNILGGEASGSVVGNLVGYVGENILGGEALMGVVGSILGTCDVICDVVEVMMIQIVSCV